MYAYSLLNNIFVKVFEQIPRNFFPRNKFFKQVQSSLLFDNNCFVTCRVMWWWCHRFYIGSVFLYFKQVFCLQNAYRNRFFPSTISLFKITFVIFLKNWNFTIPLYNNIVFIIVLYYEFKHRTVDTLMA